MDFHEYADIFPLMTSDEIDALAEDIKQNGLNNPITAYQGKVLDGRNRQLACDKAGVAVDAKEFKGDDEQALGFVWSQNEKRRHLTSSQRAQCAVEFEGVYGKLKEDAEKRQKATIMKKGQKGFQPVSNVVATLPPRKSRDTMAKKFNTSPRYIDQAAKIKKERPEDAELVKAGVKTIPQVVKEMDKEKSVKEGKKAHTAVLERINKEELIATSFKAAFDTFHSEIEKAKTDGWQETSKGTALRCIDSLSILVNI